MDRCIVPGVIMRFPKVVLICVQIVALVSFAFVVKQIVWPVEKQTVEEHVEYPVHKSEPYVESPEEWAERMERCVETNRTYVRYRMEYFPDPDSPKSEDPRILSLNKMYGGDEFRSVTWTATAQSLGRIRQAISDAPVVAKWVERKQELAEQGWTQFYAQRGPEFPRILTEEAIAENFKRYSKHLFVPGKPERGTYAEVELERGEKFGVVFRYKGHRPDRNRAPKVRENEYGFPEWHKIHMYWVQIVPVR